jgi:hypothetical protein
MRDQEGNYQEEIHSVKFHDNVPLEWAMPLTENLLDKIA